MKDQEVQVLEEKDTDPQVLLLKKKDIQGQIEL